MGGGREEKPILESEPDLWVGEDGREGEAKSVPQQGNQHPFLGAGMSGSWPQELGYIPLAWCALTGNKGEVIPEMKPKLYFVRLAEAKLSSERIKN